jgi:hypothetical protein
LINELTEGAAPAGALRLAAVFRDLAVTQVHAFLLFMVGGLLVGVFSGWLLSLFVPQVTVNENLGMNKHTLR